MKSRELHARKLLVPSNPKTEGTVPGRIYRNWIHHEGHEVPEGRTLTRAALTLLVIPSRARRRGTLSVVWKITQAFYSATGVEAAYSRAKR